MWAAGAVLLAMQAVPAGFHNRPGADAALVARELQRCRAIATGPTVEGRALTPPIGATEPVLSSEDGCMAARGWRYYRLTGRDRARLAKLPASRRAAVLRDLVGARRPAYGMRVTAGAADLLRR
ncbi:hypothetical protein [Sphingomonas sp. VNH70]|uniref:hypothetical protein n=1 Tax=Sphingomonas silueang TaxID=3156617 RepID=UPI0032B31BC5